VTRVLDWDGCVNVRDLGGLPTAAGETRFGVLVRADNVRMLSDAGWDALAAHGVRRIVDLRWPEELAEDPPRDVDIDVVHVSLLGEFDPDYVDDIADYIEADDAAGYWSGFYTRMLEQFRPNFGSVVAAIADAPPGVTLFHCAGGKDRTGLIAALVLRVAGAPVDAIAEDYSLSGPNLVRGPNAWVNAARDEADRRRRVFMQRTPPEAMAATLHALEERHGDVRSYLRAAGVSDEQLDRLRERLVAA
jgi:protein-tyrosine phosphatase